MAKLLHEFDTGTFTMKDGTAVTPLEIEIPYVNGDFNLDGMGPDRKADVVYQIRGELHSVRPGETEFPTFTFTCAYTAFTAATSSTILDFIHGKAGTDFAARVTTHADGEIMMFDLHWTNGAGEEVVFEDVRIKYSTGEGGPNTISITGTVYGAITGAIELAA